MLDARLHALEQPQRLQRCAQSGLGRDWGRGRPLPPCTRWNVVQLEAERQ
jgi:hypothetical protein